MPVPRRAGGRDGGGGQVYVSPASRELLATSGCRRGATLHERTLEVPLRPHHTQPPLASPDLTMAPSLFIRHSVPTPHLIYGLATLLLQPANPAPINPCRAHFVWRLNWTGHVEGKSLVAHASSDFS